MCLKLVMISKQKCYKSVGIFHDNMPVEKEMQTTHAWTNLAEQND